MNKVFVTVRYCRGCGARLAADRSGPECEPCGRRERGLLVAAPQVPAEFWGVDQVRDALDSWHMGRVIAAYRTHPYHRRPLSQELVGGWVGVTQAQLSRIEHGSAIKDLDRLILWAQTLRIPSRHLWFKLPEQRPISVADRYAGATAWVPSRPDQDVVCSQDQEIRHGGQPRSR